MEKSIAIIFLSGKNLRKWIFCSILACLSLGCGDQKDPEEHDQRLGHVVLQVSDLNRSQQFYESVLNMRTTEEAVYDGDKRIFLSATDSHHELVLKEGLREPIETGKRYIQQLAIIVKDGEELTRYYRKLQQKGIETELTDNQVSWSLYFYDPDSVYIEVYWDVRDQPFGKQKLRGIQEELTPEQLPEPES